MQVPKDVSTDVFITVLAKDWKQTKRPPRGDFFIIWYILTMECYAALKKTEAYSQAYIQKK